MAADVALAEERRAADAAAATGAAVTQDALVARAKRLISARAASAAGALRLRRLLALCLRSALRDCAGAPSPAAAVAAADASAAATAASPVAPESCSSSSPERVLLALTGADAIVSTLLRGDVGGGGDVDEHSDDEENNGGDFAAAAAVALRSPPPPPPEIVRQKRALLAHAAGPLRLAVRLRSALLLGSSAVASRGFGDFSSSRPEYSERGYSATTRSAYDRALWPLALAALDKDGSDGSSGAYGGGACDTATATLAPTATTAAAQCFARAFAEQVLTVPLLTARLSAGALDALAAPSRWVSCVATLDAALQLAPATAAFAGAFLCPDALY